MDAFAHAVLSAAGQVPPPRPLGSHPPFVVLPSLLYAIAWVDHWTAS